MGIDHDGDSAFAGVRLQQNGHLKLSKEFGIDWVFHAFLLCAVVFWALAIGGAVRAYSPVPFNDMWISYINLPSEFSSIDWSTWWEQHNEHRIVLARLVFWADLAWFKGAGWFLLAVNYILLALICVVFWLVLQESCEKPYRFFGLFLVIWLSLWIQKENLTWGFQSQFFLAQLLPLSALFMLHRTVAAGRDGSKQFLAACFFGLLSLGTMANGVLALPLMTVYAVVVRLDWKRVLLLGALSFLGVWSYFHNYQSISYHGSLSTTLRDNPVGLLHYVLLYLGGPFFHLLRGGEAALIVARVAGVALLIFSAYCLWQSVHSVSRSSLRLALLTFIIYIAGTAFGTGGGRLIFGETQALASRYSTPALMAWAAFFALLFPKAIQLADPQRWKLWMPLLAFVCAILPFQMSALESQEAALFEKNVGALALEMGVKDVGQIRAVFPGAVKESSQSENAVARNVSVFGLPPFKDVREQLGGILLSPDRVCKGHVDQTESVDDGSYLRVSGWFFDQERKTVPRSLWIVGSDGTVVGYALLGQPRPDLGTAIDPVAVNSGFKGYVLSKTQGLPVKIFSSESSCTISAKLPLNIYRVLSGMEPDQVTVASDSVVAGNKWLGGDFQRSHLNGLLVLGSFINSDFDTGAISLRLKRGDRILYRSGPKGGRQFIGLSRGDSLKTPLPVAVDWTILEFSNPVLPDEFVITFSDEGDGWGEWSAIAIQN